MFKEMKSRRLALLVAIALGGGGFLSSAQNVSAADVVIDDAHPSVAADHKVGTDGAAGGVVKDLSGTADVTGNTLTLTKRAFGGRLFGGYTAGSGNVTGNKVFIHNETAHVVQEKVYGGHANGSGNATSNTVTLTGGTFSDNIYGGSSVGGNATRNTVNLGDGTKAFAGTIHGTIYGGDGPGTGNHVTGNTLNVNADVTVGNIKNFETIHFNYNKNINTGNAILTLGGGSGATTVDWNGIHLNGTPERSKMTLMQNTNGININNYTPNKVIALDDKFESYITGETPHSPTKYSSIVYKRNQFAGVEKTVDTSDGIPGTSEVDVYGGESVLGNTTTGNHVTITRMTGHGKVYGGYTEGDGTTADVAKRYDSKGNKVAITGGAASELYGGYTSSAAGVATGNMVTVKGGTVRHLIYGGFAEHGDATGNTVNLGDAETGAVGNVAGSNIFGGRSGDNTKDQTTGNTLNVNARTTAYNIENFAKINFNFKHVTGNTPLLTLTGTEQTKIKDLGMLDVQNVPRGEGPLLENTHGIVVSDYNGAVSKTYEKTETIIDKNGTTKIDYKGYQFKGARDSRTVGNATWGGRSVIGNTTTDNIVTLTGNYAGQNVYGGWTSGTGSTATGENAQNHSIGNKITLTGATSEVLHMTGGATNIAGGKATGNHAILSEGRVTGNLTGGSATNGEVSGNTVEINGGRVDFLTYGGVTGGTGTAKNNKVTLTNGTVNSDIYGGVAASGNAEGNIVNIKGGSAANHDVYGGFSTNGDATGNTVTVTAGSVRNIDGGRTGSGNATGNTVNIGDGQAAYTGSISGNINGGNSSGGGRDYTTGNILNVYDNARAANINNFAEINFRFNEYVNKNATFLTLTDGNGTNLRSLSDLKLHGTHNHKGTLIQAASAITVTDGQNRLAKTEGDTKEFVLAKSSDSKKITYESYIFKGATTPTTDDGGTYKDIFGGRSILGNTTTENTITVSDAVIYRNAYGGWTSGTGSDAPADKQKNSTLNKIKVSGAANVTGKVYGGFTDVAGGNATGNEVTITKTIVADVIGGKALGEASGNTVTVGNVTVNSITGGDGATTKDNTVNIDGTTVTSKIVGGTQANGTNNTLNVKGENSAQSVEGFQNMNFNTNGVAANRTMLNVTGGGQTKVDWNTLTVDGNGRDISLLKTTTAIDFGGTYSDGAVKSGLSADKKSETNVSVTADKKEIKYTGYQFTGGTTASVDGTKAYGGISKAGNATHHNAINVNTNYDEVYGGHTSGTSDTAVEKKNSHDNTVTITGGMLGKVYGGWTAAADGTTDKNTVNLGDGTNPLAPGTTVAEIYGGNKTATGNTLNVNTAATVGKIENFSTVAFKDAGSKLTLTTANANFDLDTIQANFDATANPTLLVENTSGLTLKDGKTFRSDLNADGTKETNIEARNSNKEIVRYGYTFKNATTVTTLGTEMWGGRSAAGNTTTGNTISVSDGRGTMTVYGGYTSGTGGTATDKNDSHTNTVTVTGGNMTVYGGWTNVGKAVSNTVNVTADAQGTLVSGYSASGEASNNVVDVRNAAFTGNITGGQGTAANYNVIRLRNASVTGTITGGLAPNAKDNTLEVSYGTGTPSSVNDFRGIQRLHFDMENAPVRNTNPLLKLTAVVGGDKNLTGMKFAVARSGATQKLEKGDTFTLMENTTAPEKKITVGSGVTAEGRDGVSRNYEFDITTDAAGKLIATVTKAGMGEQSKSIVETRAGASAFLNDGADFTAGPGMDAAKKEARAAAQSGNAPYGIWAGMGGGSLRHETGSYVDMKGWNLGVGWARENAVQAGTLTFGPFIEYGRGSYDSYLDDGTHGSGKTGFLGAGVMAKIETDSHWVDGSLRVGRTKSDYMGLSTYDTTSTYYGVQVGAGKDFHVNENDSVGAYVRYAYSHTAGTSAHLSSGETYDFNAVNSRRLRIGTRYTHGMTALSQFYAGLAWEYEFDGDARATSQGDSAPSPSLKGGSALLELGYRFAPQGSRMSYDLNLNGWQGKRKGVTGGVSVKWAF